MQKKKEKTEEGERKRGAFSRESSLRYRCHAMRAFKAQPVNAFYVTHYQLISLPTRLLDSSSLIT